MIRQARRMNFDPNDQSDLAGMPCLMTHDTSHGDRMCEQSNELDNFDS